MSLAGPRPGPAVELVSLDENCLQRILLCLTPLPDRFNAARTCKVPFAPLPLTRPQRQAPVREMFAFAAPRGATCPAAVMAQLLTIPAARTGLAFAARRTGGRPSRLALLAEYASASRDAACFPGSWRLVTRHMQFRGSQSGSTAISRRHLPFVAAPLRACNRGWRACRSSGMCSPRRSCRCAFDIRRPETQSSGSRTLCKRSPRCRTPWPRAGPNHSFALLRSVLADRARRRWHVAAHPHACRRFSSTPIRARRATRLHACRRSA